MLALLHAAEAQLGHNPAHWLVLETRRLQRSALALRCKGLTRRGADDSQWQLTDEGRCLASMQAQP